jgi:hypothetical protein
MSNHPNFRESQPPPEQGATKKPKSKPVLLGVAAVAVVAFIAGGSFAYFSGYNPFGDPEPNYAQTPSQSDVMDFSGLSQDMHLNGAPLTASAETTETSSQILRFIGSTTSILTRVGDDDTPAWTVSIPHQDIDTGDAEPLDEALDPESSEDTSDEEEKLAGTPAACRNLRRRCPVREPNGRTQRRVDDEGREHSRGRPRSRIVEGPSRGRWRRGSDRAGRSGL